MLIDVLTLDFKTIKEGTAYIDYTVIQCVDSDVNFMDVGSCTASCIRIYKNASGTVSGGSSSSSNKNSTQATGKGGKSKHPTEPTTVNASDDEYIDYNPIIASTRNILSFRIKKNNFNLAAFLVDLNF